MPQQQNSQQFSNPLLADRWDSRVVLSRNSETDKMISEIILAGIEAAFLVVGRVNK